MQPLPPVMRNFLLPLEAAEERERFAIIMDAIFDAISVTDLCQILQHWKNLLPLFFLHTG